jgi:hypothetical protein
VLSTSWVRVFRFSTSAKRLPLALRERVIGATFHSRMNREVFEQKPRYLQILEDAARRKPLDWLAIDNDAAGWPDEHRHRLVLTDDIDGINQRRILDELREKLLAMTDFKKQTGN